MFETIVEGGGSQTQEYGCSRYAASCHCEWNCPARCGNRSGWHAGIDVARGPGVQPRLLAVGYGTRVTRVRDPGSCGGLGPFAVCINSGPVDIWYGHCSKDLVGVGAQVHPGQPIAVMGSFGCSTGTHLHFEVLPAGSVDGCRSLDPTPYLRSWPQLAPPGPPGPVPTPAPVPVTPGRSAAPWLLAAGAALAIYAVKR
jgi:hypothetical protein